VNQANISSCEKEKQAKKEHVVICNMLAQQTTTIETTTTRAAISLGGNDGSQEVSFICEL
jgi:hypothetical protein